MRNNYLFALVLCHFVKMYSQGEVSVNFVDIKSKIENSESASSYSKLLKRFKEFDTTLSVEDYSLLYYGFSFQENYLKTQVDEYDLENILKAKDYQKLMIECQKVLEQNPVSLSANEKMFFSMRKMHQAPAEWLKYQKRYKKLKEAILKSGDGLSQKTAIKVIHIQDERILLKDHFGNPQIHEKTTVGSCDKFVVQPNEGNKTQEVYFDISRKLKREDEILHQK